MSDSDVKQVKVDNWGIYFLQRLKHFFNRTDYCDLTLQFQDNAQLKVHRLVLSACTEYFELLERTCEMYEDCLVMPDDLQADVVVPIVNFMYTGQLEFRADSLERLYQTSQIMNMPVLTKLLDAHRKQPVLNFNPIKRSYSKPIAKITKPVAIASSSNAPNKRSYSKAFGSVGHTVNKEKKQYVTPVKNDITNNGTSYASAAYKPGTSRKVILGDPRPTRYELPEELDTDNIFDNSFSHISYASQPLMVHPEATKRYSSKRIGIFNEASTSKKYSGSTSTVDIVECKKVLRNNRDNIFEDELLDMPISDETEMFSTSNINLKNDTPKVSNQLFDQILDHGGPRVTIETKDNKPAGNIDHAKIISEVLKKYPHLVKSNKNIKLKILNTPSTPKPSNKSRKLQNSPTPYEETDIKLKTEVPDFTYETDVLDSKEAAKLIAMGAENIKGPWICLICGTPGRALHFTSYYKFRRHLVEIHNEKPVSNICEYCGLKSLKRNYLLHHLYTKHGVEPPPSYRFPKCNLCSYVALTEGFLVKHKLTHSEHKNFRCNVCASHYHTSTQLLAHIQSTGHKYSADRRTNLQCIYCLKVFLREGNLYAHLKTNHKHAAKSDGIIDDSDEDTNEEHMLQRHASPTPNPEPAKPAIVKYEPQNYENEFEDMETQYQIQERPDGNIQLLAKKPRVVTSVTPTKQKILNTGFNVPIAKSPQKVKFAGKNTNIRNDFLQEVSISPNVNSNEEIVMIDNNEYIMRDNQLILRKKANDNEYNMVSDIMTEVDQPSPTTSMQFANVHDEISEEIIPQEKVLTKKPDNLHQPIQFVVSSEEEYKALMNSNHSIIFDDGDINKTLTVLSAPHNTTLNATAVDLDSAQSSDMMIIPDNYPLNVSEAIPTDNSNIVVVYSHPVDDQDKQYQLITSQDIGAQFVQTSAVITQNFGAITTSTPVMSAHVIDSQAAETWQNNVQENVDNQEVELSTPAEVQEMTIVEQAEMTSIDGETNNSLHEFPEVTLESEEPQENIIQESEMSENVSNNINTEGVEENVEQTVVEETQQVLTPMDYVVQSEIVTEEDTNAEKSSENIDENKSHDDIHTETLNINEEQPIEESNIVEHGREEIVEATESINEENPKSENAVIETSKVEEESGNSQALSGSVQIVNINNEEVTLTKVNKEQIQTLASEWSEDEDETEVQDTNDTDENTSKCDQANEIPTTEKPGEVEESIENIQQEMEKQINNSIEQEAVSEDSINTPIQEEDSAAVPEQEQSEKIIVAKPPPEKLSSLLNDWEDSQEENDSTNENVSIPTETQNVSLDTIECDPKETEDAVMEHAQKNDDKIKNLVSDWDDEEEENKN